MPVLPGTNYHLRPTVANFAFIYWILKAAILPCLFFLYKAIRPRIRRFRFKNWIRSWRPRNWSQGRTIGYEQPRTVHQLSDMGQGASSPAGPPPRRPREIPVPVQRELTAEEKEEVERKREEERVRRLQALEQRLAPKKTRSPPLPNTQGRKKSALEEASAENKGWRDVDDSRKWMSYE